MLSKDVKYRLSIAFDSTKDSICTCRDVVIESSIPTPEKSRILEDLNDIKNILKQQKFGDVDAIEEAIVALNEAYTRAGNLACGGHVNESLGHTLQWLEYIKKTLGYEGLVPSSMEDIRYGSRTVQRTSISPSNYGYLDDSGTFIPAGCIENNPQGYQGLNYFPSF